MSKLQYLLDELAPYLKNQRKTSAFTTNDVKRPILFAVHGTTSSPETWENSNPVFDAVVRYFGFSHNHTIYNPLFTWDVDENGNPVEPNDYTTFHVDNNLPKGTLNHLLNSPEERTKATKLLFSYIMSSYNKTFLREILMKKNNGNPKTLKEAIKGSLKHWGSEVQKMYKRHPIILVAHSHGGNICIQLCTLLKDIGIEVYLCTLGTPVYENTIEDPSRYSDTITEHAHFWTSSDWVQGRVSKSDEIYTNKTVTKNHNIPTNVGHSFHSKSPFLAADCINFYAKNKTVTEIPLNFHKSLRDTHGSFLQYHSEEERTWFGK